ncbi:hypothetical protein TSUD_69240 [Trifolium subterraneum]|uniref:Uncharacterized protein n=1 Tax=Trifolium subterraneum TaxID=3900 RepID=A0A2Z6N7T7_TRISU|nr:hypothetical protein TSUD_69240 [Trifolium subterraneum]
MILTEKLHNRVGGWGVLAIACAMNTKGRHLQLLPAQFYVPPAIIAVNPKWNSVCLVQECLKEKRE